MSRPTVVPGEVARVKPRVFRQVGKVTIKAGDQLVRSHDFSTFTATTPAEEVATRVVLKDGTPLGPWLFPYGVFMCRLEGEERGS